MSGLGSFEQAVKGGQAWAVQALADRLPGCGKGGHGEWQIAQGSHIAAGQRLFHRCQMELEGILSLLNGAGIHRSQRDALTPGFEIGKGLHPAPQRLKNAQQIPGRQLRPTARLVVAGVAQDEVFDRSLGGQAEEQTFLLVPLPALGQLATERLGQVLAFGVEQQRVLANAARKAAVKHAGNNDGPETPATGGSQITDENTVGLSCRDGV